MLVKVRGVGRSQLCNQRAESLSVAQIAIAGLRLQAKSSRPLLQIIQRSFRIRAAQADHSRPAVVPQVRSSTQSQQAKLCIGVSAKNCLQQRSQAVVLPEKTCRLTGLPLLSCRTSTDLPAILQASRARRLAPGTDQEGLFEKEAR